MKFSCNHDQEKAEGGPVEKGGNVRQRQQAQREKSMHCHRVGAGWARATAILGRWVGLSSQSLAVVSANRLALFETVLPCVGPT
jgi:hypothetical protein